MSAPAVLAPQHYRALDAAGYPILATSVAPVNDHGMAYRDLFRLETSDGRAYALKVRRRDTRHVQVALSVLPTVNDPEGLLEQYAAAIAVDDDVLLLTRWIAGSTARDAPTYLPELFARLARFHAANPWRGQVTTKYVDGKPFDRIQDMLESEISVLLTDLPAEIDPHRVRGGLEPLRSGLSCITHDDVNPGNIMVYRDAPMLIDCEWVHGGLSLLDLEYLDLLSIDTGKWWAIQDQATACLRAYFGQLGLAASEANRQATAFGLLQAIRHNTYVRCRRETSAYESARGAIEAALAGRVYV